MKRLLVFVIPFVLLSSCIIETVEPRYPTDSRERIVGYYNAEEYSETYRTRFYYSLRISKSSYNGNDIILHNFYGSGLEVRATFDYNQIHIPYQVVNGYEIDGTGTVYGYEIDFNYRVKDLYSNSYADFCEMKAVFDF